MNADPSRDHDAVSTPPRERWWQRLEAKWNRIQVGRQGSYSVERLESFDHYCKTTSPTRVFLVCILTPLPALLAPLLLESLPLRPPSESWTANWMYWIRLGLANFVMNFAGMSLLVPLVPDLNTTLGRRLILCVVATGGYVASFVLRAAVVGFPVPFTLYIGRLFVALYIPVTMLFVFGRNTFSRSSPRRPNLQRFFSCFRGFMTQTTIFPFYKLLYGFVPASYRGLVVLVLPVWRFAAKEYMVSCTRGMEDFIPEIVAMTVDFFSALFVSGCMSTTGSFYLSALFIVVDLGQSVLEFRDLRMNATSVFERLQDLKKESSSYGKIIKNPDTCNLPTFILSVARDPNAFHATSFEGIRLRACYPHPLARGQAENLARLQATQAYQPSDVASPIRPTPPRSFQIQRTRIAPTPPEISTISSKEADAGPYDLQVFEATPTATAASGEISQNVVIQGLQLMFHCEYLILVEYVECIVPLMYVMYKTILEHLPNVVYYPGGAEQIGAAAVVNILVYAGLEIVTLLLFHVFLQRKFAFSPLYQLAFVLETQIYMVQTQLFIESIFLLQYSSHTTVRSQLCPNEFLQNNY